MTRRIFKLSAIALSVAVLAGCASVTPQGVLTDTAQRMGQQTPAPIVLISTSSEQTAAQARANNLLAQALDQAAAVELAMTNSPAFQAMLANGVANSSTAAQGGRIANPQFGFERMQATGVA